MTSYRIDTSKLDQIIANTPAKVDDWLRGVAVQIADDIRLSLGTGEPGRTYKRGDRVHVASSPGGPPAIDLGTLSGSIRWRKLRVHEYRIEAGTQYAQYLEEGTERMGARPFFQPVIHRWTRRLESDARNHGLIE